jgi:hypothetical protein
MMKANQQEAFRALARAYDQHKEAGKKRCGVSKRAREVLKQELFDGGMSDQRTTLGRFCVALSWRMSNERPFDLLQGLPFFDATLDLLNYSEPQDWKITSDLELGFV